MSDQAQEPAQPAPDDAPVAVRVVRGEPTAEEVAALVVVLAASAGGGGGDQPAPRSLWATSGRPRAPHAAGPGAWRASALPR